MALFNRIATLAFCGFLITTATNWSAAQEFRVESQVFVEGTATPVSENLTLFNGQIAYDFQLATDGSNAVKEVVVFDARNRQFVLLDIKREIRTDIAEYEILKMVENLRGVSEIDEDTNFLLNPRFELEVDHTKKTISLTNDDMTYRATGAENVNRDALGIYFDSMDQMTRLSASDPTRLPPFARLALNQEIRRNSFFPAEIQVTYRAGAVTKDEFSARSKHTPVWQLSKEDHLRIQKAKQQWMQFEKVSLGVYRGLEQQAASK